ncbi:hypothetical protein [Bacteroides sp.]|uniref:hypothetical protein n=1 Tax=Bacteroides sp. TaxID=29523 RepID=UPI00260538F5|nr:hypothetical protein [Bacteroides sp.]
MGRIGKGVVMLGLLIGLGGCIPDDLGDCPAPDGKKDGVDITVDMDTDVDTGQQETEMP